MTVGRQSIAIDLRRRAIDDYVGLSRVRVRRRGGRELRDEPYGSSRPGGSQTGHAEEPVVHESSSSPPDVRRCEPVSVHDTRSSPLRQSIVGAPSPTFPRYSPTTRQPPPPAPPGTPPAARGRVCRSAGLAAALAALLTGHVVDEEVLTQPLG